MYRIANAKSHKYQLKSLFGYHRVLNLQLTWLSRASIVLGLVKDIHHLECLNYLIASVVS